MKRTEVKDALCLEANEALVNLKGWVRTKRGSKNVSFIALNDGSTIHMGTWSYHFDGIFSATTILMAATAVQVAISAALRGRIERREIWILLAVGVLVE